MSKKAEATFYQILALEENHFIIISNLKMQVCQLV